MANGNGAKTKKQLVKDLETGPLSATTLKDLEAERKQVEEAFKKSDQEKTDILNSLSELVIFQDMEHRVVWTNRIAGESVGLPPEKLVGRYCYDVWGRGGGSCPGCPVAKACKTGKPEVGEMATPDGKVWLIKGYRFEMVTAKSPAWWSWPWKLLSASRRKKSFRKKKTSYNR